MADPIHTVAFLDLPPLLCAWRVVRRWLRGRTRHAVDLAPGLRHKVSLSFFVYVVTFRRRRRPLLASSAPGHWLRLGFARLLLQGEAGSR